MLKRALEIAEQIEKLENELAGILNNDSTPRPTGSSRASQPRKKKRTVSPEARAKMAESQRARWAKRKMGKEA